MYATIHSTSSSFAPAQGDLLDLWRLPLNASHFFAAPTSCGPKGAMRDWFDFRREVVRATITGVPPFALSLCRIPVQQ
jgi:hypothetical protein